MCAYAAMIFFIWFISNVREFKSFVFKVRYILDLNLNIYLTHISDEYFSKY